MNADPTQAWRAHTGFTAWPSILLAIAAWVGWISVVVAHAAGVLSAVAATLLNTCIVYVAFTPLHEATHGNIGGSKERAWMDEVVGWAMAITMLSPYPAFRSIHLRHHAKTNDPEHDPDMWVQGSWPVALLKSFAILPHYDHFFLTKLVHTSRSAREQRTLVVVGLLAMVAVLLGLSAAGFGHTVVFALVLPALGGTGLLAFLFDWLPHHPHRVVGRFVDTRVIEDGWMTLPLLWQNFHLVHHLWPRVPFYRYATVFREARPLLEDKGSPIEHWTGRAAASPANSAG